MKVYIVIEESGTCEDSISTIEKVFTSYDKAQKYVKAREILLKKEIAKNKRCERCPFVDEVDEIKDKDTFITKAKKYCEDINVESVGDEYYMPCYYVDYDLEYAGYKIESRDVE